MAGFQPSKLGTREYWDHVYREEINNFNEIGDEGEIWFGEDRMMKMVEWTLKHAPPSCRILEVGSGNGVLLCELAASGYDPSQLLGIDYSHGSVSLSRQVAQKRGISQLSFKQCDFLAEDPPSIAQMEEPIAAWDILLDKGTFDAISLADKNISGATPAELYPERVSRLLRAGGLFLITSCNFTEEELKDKFLTPDLGLTYQYVSHAKIH